jgi:uncharacterized integral membrane protein
MSDDQSIETTSPPSSRTRNFGHDVRLVFATIVLVVFVVFALANRRSTHVSWIAGSGSAPLWLLLVISATAGWIIGLLVSVRAKHRHR